MWSLRGSLIYTAFATAVFVFIQWLDDLRDPPALAVTGIMFFLFTFFMLRLIQRVMMLVMRNRGPRAPRGQRGRDAEREPGPAVVPPRTDRPEHVRRRRERRRRRR